MHPASQKPPLVRRDRKRAAKAIRNIAYDFETTSIRPGSPRPLYLTCWSPDYQLATPVRSWTDLHSILTERMLVPELEGRRFVAWNGNRFDAYFVAAALVRDTRYRIRPFLTRSRELRGLIITPHADPTSKGWTFACGMAMLGIETTLEELLESFAPDLPKLPAPDWSQGFDADDPAHQAYAMRDSEGLWHAIERAQRIVVQEFGETLSGTAGATGIKVFQATMPAGVKVIPPDDQAETVIREYLSRGGYVFCRGRYTGQVWKYDLNQAYAGAMRECQLPAGSMLWDRYGPEATTGAYMVRVSGHKPTNTVPFYCKSEDALGRIRAQYARTHFENTWITSDEHRQLLAEGWDIEAHEHYAWARTFSMSDFVDRLEQLRREAPGGPHGPTGLMVKSIGNNSYGKTAEQQDGIEWIVASERPEGFHDYYEADDAEPVEHIFWRADPEPRRRPYHQPQLACFITAFVRMQVRRAALLDPAAWLYADTDCVMFSRDMGELLDIDPARYGAWKVEAAGEHYRIIMQKVYMTGSGKIVSRGINPEKITGEQFDRWMKGEAPSDRQVQLRNFLDVMRGAEMYRAVTRRGSAAQPEEMTE
jgi:hypothetical protein